MSETGLCSTMCTTCNSTGPLPRPQVLGSAPHDPGGLRRGVVGGLALSWVHLAARMIEVLDEQGNPVPAAVIQNNAGTARMTDIEGRLELDSLLRQGDTLEIRALALEPDHGHAGSGLDLEVQLAPESVNLLEVVVAVSEPSRQTMGTTTGHCPPRPLPGRCPRMRRRCF